MGGEAFDHSTPSGSRLAADISQREVGAWIVRIAEEGHRASFVALFEHFAPKVKTYLMRRGLADGLAEELAQETLLTVWRKAALFDPSRASAAGWIYTIARNLRIDALRRERHPDDLAYPQPDAPATTPEQDLWSRQGEQRLRAAIRALPPEQAQVLRLAFFEERSHAQIARALDMPLGTVKSRIRLATAHLRTVLDDPQ